MKHIILAAAVAMAAPAFAYSFTDSLTYSVGATATLTHGNHSPLWLTANRHGLASAEKNFGFTQATLVKPSGKLSRKLTYGWGVDVAAGWNMQAPFLVQQLYGELKYWHFTVTLGQKNHNTAFNDPRLSSGDLLFSGNARAIQQLRVAIDDYWDIPGLRRLLAVKGYFGVGFFTDGNWQKSWTHHTRYTKNVLYQTKGLTLRLGNRERFPLTYEFGLQMGAQWGGELFNDGEETKFPHSFRDFWRTFFCKGGGSDSPGAEQQNVNGNTVGEWSMQLGWDAGDWGVKAYYNHMFEDQSMMVMEYTWHDGQIGVEVRPPRNPFVTKAVYEYLYTKYQSGPVFWDHNSVIDQQVSARDDYYNHYLYAGWENWGFGMGNPLLVSPIYNKDHTLRFKDTRIIAHHLGIEGQPLPRLGYRLLVSHMRSWGTYKAPAREVRKSTSAMLELTYDCPFWQGFTITATGALDHGSLLGNNAGAMLTLRKTGIFSL